MGGSNRTTEPSDILCGVIAHGLVAGVIGMGLGLAGARALTRHREALLFEMKLSEPVATRLIRIVAQPL